MQIYDCKSNRWNINSTYLQGFPSSSKLVFHDGTLYKGVDIVDLPYDQFGQYTVYTVYRYDFAKNNWQHVIAHRRKRMSSLTVFDHELMSVSGRLLIVGANDTKVSIWELQLSPLEWKVVTTKTYWVLQLFNKHIYPGIDFEKEDKICCDSFGIGDHVLFIGSIERIGMPQFYEVYKLSTDSWISLTNDVDILDSDLLGSSRYFINT